MGLCSFPVVWPEAAPILEFSVSMVGLTATSSRRTYANMPHPPCLLLPMPLTPQQATADALQIPKQASLAQPRVGSLPLSPGSWCTQGFVCALQESLFPPVLWKFCNPITQVPSNLEIPSPFALSPGWEACSGTKNLHIRARTSLV